MAEIVGENAHVIHASNAPEPAIMFADMRRASGCVDESGLVCLSASQWDLGSGGPAGGHLRGGNPPTA